MVKSRNNAIQFVQSFLKVKHEGIFFYLHRDVIPFIAVSISLLSTSI